MFLWNKRFRGLEVLKPSQPLAFSAESTWTQQEPPEIPGYPQKAGLFYTRFQGFQALLIAAYTTKNTSSFIG